MRAREELYKPKLLINVTEEQKKEKEREKQIEREKKQREREKEEWERGQRRIEEQQHIDDSDRLKAQEADPNDQEIDETRDKNENERVNENDDESNKGGFNRSLSNSPAPLPNASPHSPSPENNVYGTPPIAVPAPHSAQSSSDNDKMGKFRISLAILLYLKSFFNELFMCNQMVPVIRRKRIKRSVRN